jgi:two-component system nitrate/nitrite response regulator NarL
LETKPDVMLLDYALPGYSGVEVLRRMHDAGSPTRVLFLTAGMDRAEVLQALELGARGVVLKDAAAELLGKAIACILAGEYWIGREVVADWFEYSHRQRAPRLTLTQREHDITDQVLTGKTNREIGAALGISEETVKRHIRNIYDKLGVSNRMELALYISSGKLEQ